jgi:hypothetical protein
MRIPFSDGTAVIVQPAPNGRYIACLDAASEHGERLVWGLGNTVLAAIANLNKELEEGE